MGGAENLFCNALPIYKSKLNQVDALIIKKANTDLEHKFSENFKGDISYLISNSLYNPLILLKLMGLIRKYDIIHVHLFPALYWVVVAKILSFSKSTKLIYTEHSTHNKRRDSRIFKLVDKFIYSKLSFIGAISDATASNLNNHLVNSKVPMEVIHNGINLMNFESTEEKTIRNQNFKVLQISSFRRQKDQKTLIESFQYLPANFELYLVGEGPLLSENRNLVEKLNLKNRVHFLGVRTDISALINSVDVCVLSSNIEGFGLAIVEGMAMSKPCIASNIDGLKEIVEGYGILFEKGNSVELAKEINALYENPLYYNKIAKQCLIRSQDFDLENMVLKYIKVYEKY